MQSVAAFTDTYLPTVNGVTYTIQTWRERWQRRGGRMDVIFPDDDEYESEPGEYPVRSLPFPFYEGLRIGAPRIPKAVEDADIVHAHTPFGLGLAGLRLARRHDLPLVATYHTPTAEYAEYLSSVGAIERGVERTAERYERWFFDRADAVIVPSEDAKRRLLEEVGVDADIAVLSNGIDIEQFAPADGDEFRRRHDLGDGPIIGYTGRHGYEKHLDELIRAAADLDVTLVFGGDGPARDQLERLARNLGVDARFLGFLDREDLPAFYSALDVFCFPSPVETQGLVALEANACGTPVVGVNEGALEDTVVDGVTGYHYESRDLEGFRHGIRRALSERDELSARCLDRRDEVSVDHSVDRLAALYDRVESQ
ncbi:glycosyltransferase family 4 protein [Haloferax mediterranei ATCC 33500]|uniref:Glycosyl transferase family 1 n=2 Tax=Haloferax TaxID=2251 RepID=I3R3T4_HALMT|nr:glycosyltransferase family 4 protein [Haloferax mediterranei]AFK18894.1 glycosyltransferase [Haloferax mediterranei ATCC 33500]AHZ21741.1 glycosyl transferase family 1 [Haloferax mediterranei ATCC 33500]EMA03247.1 glycosyltransferase [Haloferax mediterranei ATCC 33500]MDX5988988.1 glycosyltransferase family 4 protein [Haloferax mediterranei ATCC 33500]QCQ75381.1 glycosyltransferase family 4 protein [Haloferax mediterranei ATCC 33500]